MEPGIYTGVGDMADFPDGQVQLKTTIDYAKFLKQHTFVAQDMPIEPYYIKKPNIT